MRCGERHRFAVATFSLVVGVLLVAACGSSETATDPADDSGAGVSFPLEAYNDSKLEGATALLTAQGSEQTLIEVDGIVEGSPFGGGPHRVELTRGDCGQPGDLEANLGAVTDEKAEGVVNLGLGELVEGEFVLAVWFTGKSPKTLIACADVPDSIETSD